MDSRHDMVSKLTRDFSELDSGLNGESRSFVHQLRKTAAARFVSMGFPTIHHEEWKYTNLKPLLNTGFQPVLQNTELPELSALPENLPYLGDAENLLVFVNGRFDAGLSRMPASGGGLLVENLAEAVKSNRQEVVSHLSTLNRDRRNVFSEINTAFLLDGALIHVPKNHKVSEPLHIVYLTVPGELPLLTAPRTLLVADEGSSVSVVETYASAEDSVHMTNAVSEFLIARNARVAHASVQLESRKAYHIGNIMASQRGDSVFESRSFTFGAAITRNDVSILLDEQGAESVLDGLYMPDGKQHVDNHTEIDHAKPNCNSHELYKGILRDSARGVFSGKIIVREDAQKTDAKQSNNNLLLSETASIDTKPQLEIFADDVKCTHGATIGRLDDDARFYLRSRGIGAREADAILTYAFASEIVERVSIGSLHTFLDEFIHERLQ